MGKRLSDFKTRITAAAAAAFNGLLPAAKTQPVLDEQAEALGLVDFGPVSKVTRGSAVMSPPFIEEAEFEEAGSKRSPLLTPSDLASPIRYEALGEDDSYDFAVGI